jgi:glycosyltransferase involved in cell wall biosynthesis
MDASIIPNGVTVSDARAAEPGTHLLCCDPGLPHKRVEVARRVARALGLELREVGRGVRWLPHAELRAELSSAAAVLCPSRDEGFGMIALETLAAGRPLVASDLPAHREVCGASPFYAPVDKVDAWVEATRHALDAGAERLDAGRERARRYTWEAAADRLAELVRTVLRNEDVAEVDQTGEDADQEQVGHHAPDR